MLRVWQSGHLISWPILSSGAYARVPHRWHTTATSVGFGFCLGGGGGRRLGSTRMSGGRDLGFGIWDWGPAEDGGMATAVGPAAFSEVRDEGGGGGGCGPGGRR